ncbi:MAG: FixG Ig-like domain-containing protein, partial [Rhodoferax sp.]
RMGYARGLVKYSTDNAIKQGWSQAQTLRHVLRPRVLVYTTILGAIVLAMLISLTLRTPFKVDVVRDRGVMARIVAGGKIENVYRLQIMNATESGQRYRITASGLPGLTVSSESTVPVESTQARWVAVRLQLPAEGTAPGSHTIHFEIESLDLPGHVTEKSVFLVPR